MCTGVRILAVGAPDYVHRCKDLESSGVSACGTGGAAGPAESAGVRQYRDMVDSTLEHTPVLEPQRPACADVEDEADALNPVELHTQEGAPGMQPVLHASCSKQRFRSGYALWWRALKHYRGRDADMDEGLAEDLERVRLAAAAAAPAVQRVAPAQEAGGQETWEKEHFSWRVGEIVCSHMR